MPANIKKQDHDIALFLRPAKNIRLIKKFLLGTNLLLLFLLFCYAVYRDIHLIRQFPADLRNRVVGARLMDAGRLPYYYKWRKGDSIAWLDYNNYGSVRLSNMTASPFMHQLMMPLSHLPQKTISNIWLILEYLFWLIIVGAGILLCSTATQRIISLNAGLSFLFTEAWINHIYVGQMYLLVAAVSAVIAVLLVKQSSSRKQVAAGVLAIAVILIRPIFLLFLIPFMFNLSKTRFFFFAIISGVTLYGLFILSSPFQRNVWMEYRSAVQDHIKMHQQGQLAVTAEQSLPAVRFFEGYDMEEVQRAAEASRYTKQSENGNVFVLYRLATHHRMSLFWLNATCLLLIMYLFWRYEVLKERFGFNMQHAVIVGLALYMVMEIFLPVHRHQYNTVQFFPMILLLISRTIHVMRPAFFICIAGLLLNITNTHLIPLRHTLGELFILFAILLDVLNSNKEITNGPKGDHYRSRTGRIDSSL